MSFRDDGSTVAIDGTVEGGYDEPTLWNGHGTIRRDSLAIYSGSVEATTINQLRDSDICAGEGISGSTTLQGRSPGFVYGLAALRSHRASLFDYCYLLILYELSYLLLVPHLVVVDFVCPLRILDKRIDLTKIRCPGISWCVSKICYLEPTPTSRTIV